MPAREIRVLNVAEKPSVAREITRHLGGGAEERRQVHGSWVAEFPFVLRQTPCRMVVTAVRGHLKELDFGEECKGWKSIPPGQLFRAPVVWSVNKGGRDLDLMLKQLARQCQWLVLWLDCDREGEAIAFEVLETCQRAAQGRLQVFRAVFSALTRQDLVNACNTLRQPDQRLAHAVEARQEIDLRIGSAFTRWMTLRYHAMFPELSQQVLSFGPCQFPTLGFVVQRWLRIQRFVPEPFWTIRAEVPKAGQSVKFAWRRGRLFDRLAVLALYELCVEAAPAGATVTRVAEEPKSRRPRTRESAKSPAAATKEGQRALRTPLHIRTLVFLCAMHDGRDATRHDIRLASRGMRRGRATRARCREGFALRSSPLQLRTLPSWCVVCARACVSPSLSLSLSLSLSRGCYAPGA